MEQLERNKPKERTELWRRWCTKNEINACTQVCMHIGVLPALSMHLLFAGLDPFQKC